MEESDKDYKKLSHLYKELFDIKNDREKFEKKKKEISVRRYCPKCGSIFREYMCEERHLCTAFKFCPICGKESSLSC